MSAKAAKAFVGLGVLSRHLHRGQVPTFQTMQDFIQAGGESISRERLRQIEFRALRKLRIRMKMTPEEVRSALSLFR